MVLEEIFEKIRELHPANPENSLLIAVTGYTGSGKTMFQINFSDYIQQRGVSPIKLSSDFYHRRSREVKKEIFRKERANGGNLVRAYEDAYAHEVELMAEHFRMIKARQSFTKDEMYQGETGEKNFKLEVDFSGKKETWTLIEGVYVLSPKVRPLLDQVVLMEASTDQRHLRVAQRALARALPIKVDADIMEAADIMNRRWIDSQRRPTDIVINNDNYNAPSILNSLQV